jgi:hypothetical protein
MIKEGSILMSDNELDEILKEIKQHSSSENSDDAPQQNADEKIEKASDLTEKQELKFEEEPNNIPEEPDDDNPLTMAKPVDDSQEESDDVEFAFDPNGEKLDEAVGADEIAAAIMNEDGYKELDELEKEATDLDGAEKAEEQKPKNKKKKIVITVVVIVLVALIAGLLFGKYYYDNQNKPSTDTGSNDNSETISVSDVDIQEDTVTNPLTGESGYNQSAVNQRPVAVVVENEYSTASVKPQWGLSDADIVMEGESEYSTRMLLFWADYTSVPEQVGPCRSARPPFIRFSQLFDSVFIHCGLSRSKGNYVGADTVFQTENVDHINGLAGTMDGTYFGRDYSRTSTVEHTAYLNGTNLPQLLENEGIDTTLDESKFSVLTFNDEVTALSNETATSVRFTWSSRCPKKAEFTYDEAEGKYTTTDFDSTFGESNVQFENLIFLLDETEYVVKDNYKGSGNSETYCDYKLSGGTGKVLSNGTAVDITWGVTDGKLWMKTSDGKDLSLNKGKSYIGYGSSNNSGLIEVNYQ